MVTAATLVTVAVGDGAIVFECRALTGEERLGESTRVEVELASAESVAIEDALGKPCSVRIEGAHGERTLAGVVTRFTAVATSNPVAGRVYRLVMQSSLALGDLRRRTRVYQHQTVPQVIAALLGEGLYPAAAIRLQTQGDHAPREYLVQYQEGDAAFVRRLCEEEGLYFRFEAKDGEEAFVLEDISSAAEDGLDGPVVLGDASGLRSDARTAWDACLRIARRPGKVTLRDYRYDKPAVQLEATAKGSIVPAEEEVEVYEAPGRFADADQGSARAKVRLQSLRADAETVSFVTTADGIAPGTMLTLEIDPGYRGSARLDGKYFVCGVSHRYTFGAAGYQCTVHAVPEATAFRLPRLTPRPRIHGVHTAVVTGPSGEEIHTDDQGRVTVRFHWDREGPTDDKSSLPIRVAQPNTPGSMLLPRVGWEVLVVFEDGDPDRPVVMGRVYNAKQPPPQSLPANKTVTSIGTFSSPGAGTKNVVRFDDAAGREHIAIDAGFGMSTSVANNRMTQVTKVEERTVGGSQTISVGANQKVSVTQAYLVDVASQTATVGATQKIYVKGNLGVMVGSETVMVGGALLEKVGNPVAGAAAFAKSAALAGVGQLGVAGMVVSQGVGLGQAVYEGGWRGGATAAAGMLAGMIPGGDAVVAAVTSPAPPQTWQEKEAASGAAVAGGGAGAAESDSAGAGGPGPGHRIQAVSGPYTELIGGMHGVVTPGSIQWTVLGASTTLVAGSHSTKTLSHNSTTLGASTETLGSLSVDASSGFVRDVTGVLTTNIGGSLKSKAGGKHAIKAKGALTIKVGGSLSFKGGTVTFVCGGASVSSSPGGMLIEAGTITIDGTTTATGSSAHE